MIAVGDILGPVVIRMVECLHGKSWLQEEEEQTRCSDKSDRYFLHRSMAN
jgi:hypothetical protein